MIRLSPLLLLLVLAACSTQTTLYDNGDPQNRFFSDILKDRNTATDGYFRVERNKRGQIVTARSYGKDGNIVSKDVYSYDRDGQLRVRRQTTFFQQGPPQVVSEWRYQSGRLIERVDNWYTHSRSFEKKIVTSFDRYQRPYLEETFLEGSVLSSNTEFYYDHRNNLDKSQRNFFLVDGELRDYWITIYDDHERILREEHYLPNGTLLAFYRYQYHPARGFLELEEILDQNRGLFLRRNFDAQHFLLKEERLDREMNLLSYIVYEYGLNHEPMRIHHYNSSGQLVESERYREPLVHEGFRRP